MRRLRRTMSCMCPCLEERKHYIEDRENLPENYVPNEPALEEISIQEKLDKNEIKTKVKNPSIRQKETRKINLVKRASERKPKELHMINLNKFSSESYDTHYPTNLLTEGLTDLVDDDEQLSQCMQQFNRTIDSCSRQGYVSINNPMQGDFNDVQIIKPTSVNVQCIVSKTI